MTFSIIVAPEAEHEWTQTVDWYDEREPGNGSRFNSVVRLCLQDLSANPKRFPFASRLTQKAKIKGWPYSIYFVVNEAQQQITVVAIWHGARNPEKLRSRLK